MAKEDFLQEVGIVAEALPNASFLVEVPGQTELILCHLSGKMRKHFIKVLPGDRVLFEMSPYDLTRGRIVRRLRPDEDPLNQQEQLSPLPSATTAVNVTNTVPEESGSTSDTKEQ